MIYSLRSLSRALVVCVLFFILTNELRAQNSNSTGTIMWPNNPPVGIGTQLSGPFIPQNALHIHHDPGIAATLPAILRLSDGSTDTTTLFGALALMPNTVGFSYSTYSNLAKPYDLILHQNARFWGDADLLIANFDSDSGGAIRMSTTPLPGTVPVGTPPNDLERVTILQNGNVGIGLPPGGGAPSLCFPEDQVQIGGGMTPADGQAYPIPGLTIYGGNRFEKMPKPGGGFFPWDQRYLAFNQFLDHADTSLNHSHRFQPMSSSNVAFSEGAGGLIDLSCMPYDAGRGLNDFTRGISMQLTGTNGLEMWSDEGPGNPYHHLFDVWRPGHFFAGDSIRNDSGLFFHYTPVFIGYNYYNRAPLNFTNFAHVYPDIGDGKTWMLAVNGPVLVKEIFVLDSTWADYVFNPSYQLMTIENFGRFLETHHHLPEIPDAKTMEKGVPLGRTEAAVTKQMEEMALYIVQLNKKVESLESEVQQLNNQKAK